MMTLNFFLSLHNHSVQILRLTSQFRLPKKKKKVSNQSSGVDASVEVHLNFLINWVALEPAIKATHLPIF